MVVDPSPPPPQERIRGVINIIFRGESLGGDNLRKRKAITCHIFSLSTNKLPQHQPITFTLEDKEGVFYTYDDPIVVMADINRFIIKRILVDSESSYNVLTWKAIMALQVDLGRLKKLGPPLERIKGKPIKVKRSVESKGLQEDNEAILHDSQNRCAL